MLRRLAAYRHLVRRLLRNQGLRLRGELSHKREPRPLAKIWANFQCPIVNHPSQIQLLPSKLHNMEIAVRAIDGLILEPGEVFSFWQTIGRPTKSRGFQSGPTFERGKMVSTYGGGLCQISGLLFNLALESGCSIVERHSHSLDAYGEKRYLPLGRDATVAWISKDLAFRNTSGFKIRFSIGVERDRAYGRVESDVEMPYRVRIDRMEHRSRRFPDRDNWCGVQTEVFLSVDGESWSPSGAFSSEYELLVPKT